MFYNFFIQTTINNSPYAVNCLERMFRQLTAYGGLSAEHSTSMEFKACFGDERQSKL